MNIKGVNSIKCLVTHHKVFKVLGEEKLKLLTWEIRWVLLVKYLQTRIDGCWQDNNSKHFGISLLALSLAEEQLLSLEGSRICWYFLFPSFIDYNDYHHVLCLYASISLHFCMILSQKFLPHGLTWHLCSVWRMVGWLTPAQGSQNADHTAQ